MRLPSRDAVGEQRRRERGFVRGAYIRRVVRLAAANNRVGVHEVACCWILRGRSSRSAIVDRNRRLHDLAGGSALWCAGRALPKLKKCLLFKERKDGIAPRARLLFIEAAVGVADELLAPATGGKMLDRAFVVENRDANLTEIVLALAAACSFACRVDRR